MFSLSLSLFDNVSLTFLTIVPMDLGHCLCASFVDMGVVGLRMRFILMSMWIGVVVGCVRMKLYDYSTFISESCKSTYLSESRS